MAKKKYHASCHCKAVRFTVVLDLDKGTHRCNCSICWKTRAWFAIAGGDELQLLAGAEQMDDYQFTASGKPAPELTYRFCKQCGVRTYAAGDLASQGGKFFAVHIPTLDDVSIDELAAVPLTFMDNLHDRPDREPADKRLL